MKRVLLVLMVVVPAWAGSVCAQNECPGPDVIEAVVEGDVITILHSQALYNCCPTRFDYEVAMEGNLITVVETENLDGGGCWCVCCIDLSVGIAAVPPGQYTLEFHWFDYENQSWQVCALDVIVEDGAQVPDLHIAWSEHSDCYGTTGIDADDPPATWGMVKSMYR